MKPPKFYPARTALDSVERSKPENLLNALCQEMSTENDTRLARALDLPQPLISQIRNKRVRVTPFVMLRMAEATGWTVAKMRGLLHA